MDFEEFRDELRRNFNHTLGGEENLFEVDVEKDEVYKKYLESFPEGTNKIFRERREFECSACRKFIRDMGNVVMIKNGEVKTIWDFTVTDHKFQTVIDELNYYVKHKPIKDVFVTKNNSFGLESNLEKLEDGGVIEWNHFYLDLQDHLVTKDIYKSVDSIKADLRATKEVFKRSLDEITKDSIATVLELISQNSLYRGEKWKEGLERLSEFKDEYSNLETEREKDLYTWEESVDLYNSIARIRNHSIGTLLTNLSEGMPLDTAVAKYEDIVAPENYQRPKPVYTKKMLAQAKEKVNRLGFMDSLERRYAKLDDITVNNILFSNKDVAKDLNGDVFDEMEDEITVNPKKLSKVQEVSINKFVEDILPKANELEVLFENRLANNLVSLIAPVNQDSKTMFKWDNKFSWAYTGNLTDSSLKENVKNAGGKVDGVLRFSIQWNDGKHYNGNDFDAHCREPEGNHIYFSHKQNHLTTGELDVDIINPTKGKAAVENITWSDKRKMQTGKYQFAVKNYSHRGSKEGFKAEIEFNGQVYTFEYNRELKQKEVVHVADVHLSEDGTFTIDEKIDSNMTSKEEWNLNTNNFHPVTVMMHSPNHWDDQGVGSKHYFFMMKDCINDENPNGFYNEFLKSDLRPHRKVFEALGSKMSVKESENQLSGVGFSSTQDNHLFVKVKGHMDRILKIKI